MVIPVIEATTKTGPERKCPCVAGRSQRFTEYLGTAVGIHTRRTGPDGKNGYGLVQRCVDIYAFRAGSSQLL